MDFSVVDHHVAPPPETADSPCAGPNRRADDRAQLWADDGAEDQLSPEQQEAYEDLVRASTRAAVTLLVTQVLSSLVIANYGGGRLSLEQKFYFPYLAIRANQALLIKTVSWSTLITVIVTSGLALWSLRVRSQEPAVSYGWASGVVMSALLVLFQFLRHWLYPPSANVWILAQAGAIVVAAALVLVGFWPDIEPSVPNEKETSSDRVPRDERIPSNKKPRSIQ